MTRSLLLVLAMLPAATLAGHRIDCYVSNEGETRVIWLSSEASRADGSGKWADMALSKKCADAPIPGPPARRGQKSAWKETRTLRPGWL